MTSDISDDHTHPSDHPTSERFIISHRMAPYRDVRTRRSAKGNFNERLSRAVGSSMDIFADSGAERDDVRRVLVVHADEEELLAKAKELSQDTIVEREAVRWPAEFRLAPWGTPPPVSSSAANAVEGTEAVSPFTIRITSGGAPAVDANVELSLVSLVPSAQSAASLSATTDASGVATFVFDHSQWSVTTAQISPHGRVWSGILVRPQSGIAIDLGALPETGPLGWWHHLAGIGSFDPQAGQGIRIGVIDSGLGPHPYLGHIVPSGAFINGTFTPGAEATKDVLWHGTHVSGLIGARPPLDSKAFAGLAPGADVFTARVFAEGRGANQGDIAAAIDAMANAHEADLINLSLGGSPSAIEYDAVLSAYNRGALCICAAGNDFGKPILAPASYPLSVAVTALTKPGTFPISNLANFTQPQQPDRYGLGGLFLPSYSNYGPQTDCTAGGSAIISTIPAIPGEDAPYADMCGTSMATPITTAALAVLLAKDPIYVSLQRTSSRAKYARSMLETKALTIGLAQPYQGLGLSRTG